MSVPFPGFCGPSYQLDNRYAAVERLVNWYVVANESAEEKKFSLALAPCPGNAPFTPLPLPADFRGPCRGMLEYRDIVYGVNGNAVYALHPTGAMNLLGTIANDNLPVSMCANGNGQIGIASAGRFFVFGAINVPSAAGWAAEVPVDGINFFGAGYVTAQDGYVLAVTPGLNQYQISGNDDTPIGDMRLWNGANISLQGGQGDLLKAILSSREYVHLFGERRSQVHYDAGAAGIGGFPFQSYNQTFIEYGLEATFSLADLGESLIWIGQDARGNRVCWRDSTFMPRRVSTFAVEQAWAQYPTVSDAVAFPMQWAGHLWYQVTFPTAGATWVYDVTVSELLNKHVWFERNYTNAQGVQSARPEQFHVNAWGLDLVGSTGLDGNPGAVYQLPPRQYTDCGVSAGNQVQLPIVRDRICPHLWENNHRVIYDRISFELARGVGLDGAPPVGVNPQLLLRWSNDGGNKWGPEQTLAVGELGQYKQQVYWNRCGYARDRVFWLRATDPVYWGIVGATLDTRICTS